MPLIVSNFEPCHEEFCHEIRFFSLECPVRSVVALRGPHVHPRGVHRAQAELQCLSVHGFGFAGRNDGSHASRWVGLNGAAAAEFFHRFAQWRIQNWK